MNRNGSMIQSTPYSQTTLRINERIEFFNAWRLQFQKIFKLSETLTLSKLYQVSLINQLFNTQNSLLVASSISAVVDESFEICKWALQRLKIS